MYILYVYINIYLHIRICIYSTYYTIYMPLIAYSMHPYILYKPMGSSDETSLWCRARLAQTSQFKERIRLGLLAVDYQERIASKLIVIDMNAIVFFDKKHKRCVLGNRSTVERRVYRHPDTGEVCLPDDRGVLSGSKSIVTVKYDDESRFACGVGMHGPDAFRTELFNYTGRKMLGVHAFEAVVQEELKCKTPKKQRNGRRKSRKINSMRMLAASSTGHTATPVI